MVYQESFVAVVKCHGKILREQNKSEVHLPFGSEYSLLFKNLNSRRVNVNVSIDGTDILFGKSLVIDANSEMELERFLDHVSHGNKLKFIEKTEQVSNHRGDRIDDGIIRIEYAFEKPINYNWTYTYPYPTFFSNSTSNCSLISPETPLYETDMSVNLCSSVNLPSSDCGITVPGSKSQQSFEYTSIGTLENSNVIILVLKGTTKQGKVTKPLAVETKLKCITCGTKHKSSMKFCPDCGTALFII